MTVGIFSRKLLNREECWKDWITLGSLNKVRKKHIEEGRINPKTGRAFTISAIEKAAFMWIVENLEEARKDVYNVWRNEGIILTDEEWKKYIFKVGRLIYYQSPGKWREFISENGLEHLV